MNPRTFVRFSLLGLLLIPSAMTAAPTPTPAAILPVPVSYLAADPIRPRVYGTVIGSHSVIVIDTTTLKVIKKIPIGSSPQGLCVSADNSKLWVANSGSTSRAVGVVDLETLTPLQSIAAPGRPFDVEEGLSHRLYLTVSNDFRGGIAQINANTGEFEGYVGEYPFDDGVFLETSRDRKALFVSTSQSYDLRKVDISTTSPRMLQQEHFSGGREGGLSISHNGQFIVMPSGAGNGSGYSTFKIPTDNLSAVAGTFVTGAYPGPATWSNDDRLLYHSVASENVVKVFNTQTFNAIRDFPLDNNPNSTGGYDVNDLVVDRSGQWLFIAADDFFARGDVRIFSTGRSDILKPRPAPGPITFTAQSLNISTRADIRGGNNVLIGGFIITGTAPKNVIVRAIGPSLPVEGALSDPTLELHLPGGSVVTNDNWKINDSTQQSQEPRVRNTAVPPAHDRESAIA